LTTATLRHFNGRGNQQLTVGCRFVRMLYESRRSVDRTAPIRLSHKRNLDQFTESLLRDLGTSMLARVPELDRRHATTMRATVC
jgi:hypothetical protein